MDAVNFVYFGFSAICVFFGAVSVMYVPFALKYIAWDKKIHAMYEHWYFHRMVTILVPAYNEESMIAACVQSILNSSYPNFEIIVINDGSTDDTEKRIAHFIKSGAIRYFNKVNGGKSSALNLGLKEARGEIILFTDADTIFEADTILNGVRYFIDSTVGAVGGNDTPLRPGSPLQKMLIVTSHIGTGFTRRALSCANVLPIIPGNLGLVRTEILREIGGFRDLWGEDLELTFRLRRHGVRIVYGAQTRVLSECPQDLRSLWKQRVRWIRSYMKVLRLHADMLFRPRYGLFAYFLPVLSFSMMFIPAVQLAVVALLPVALHTGIVSLNTLEWLSYLGVGSLFTVAAISILLDRTPRDFRYIGYVLLLLPLSFFYNAIVVYSLWCEIRSKSENWQKIERRRAAGAREEATC